MVAEPEACIASQMIDKQGEVSILFVTTWLIPARAGLQP